MCHTACVKFVVGEKKTKYGQKTGCVSKVNVGTEVVLLCTGYYYYYVSCVCVCVSIKARSGETTTLDTHQTLIDGDIEPPHISAPPDGDIADIIGLYKVHTHISSFGLCTQARGDV